MGDALSAVALAQLQDEIAIRATLYEYCHCIDYGLEDEWLDCFTADAVWESQRSPIAALGAGEKVARGHDELAQFVAGHTRPPEAWHKHLLCEPRIELAGDRCTAISYFARVDAHVTGPFIRAFGRYQDTLVRCPDGRWRIDHRIAQIDGSHPTGQPTMGPDISHLFALEDIKRLKARYCKLLDTKEWEQWADLFTEGAQVFCGPGEGDVIEGRAAIVERVSEGLAELSTVHQVAMPDIEIIVGPSVSDQAGTRRMTARGTWGMTDYSEPRNSGTASASLPRRRWGQYDESYDFGKDRTWRIDSLRFVCLRIEVDEDPTR